MNFTRQELEYLAGWEAIWLEAMRVRKPVIPMHTPQRGVRTNYIYSYKLNSRDIMASAYLAGWKAIELEAMVAQGLHYWGQPYEKSAYAREHEAQRLRRKIKRREASDRLAKIELEMLESKGDYRVMVPPLGKRKQNLSEEVWPHCYLDGVDTFEDTFEDSWHRWQNPSRVTRRDLVEVYGQPNQRAGHRSRRR